MSLFRFFNLALVLRFVSAMRQDGLGAAIAKAIEFVARNRSDRGPTALAGVGGRPDAGHAYRLHSRNPKEGETHSDDRGSESAAMPKVSSGAARRILESDRR